MHEVSIAQSLLDLAEGYCRENNYKAINSLKVSIGTLSGVMPDALQFAFTVMKKGTMADNAGLIIDEIPVGGTCRECKKDFSVESQFVIECPLCKGTNFVITRGREMHISEMEVD